MSHRTVFKVLWDNGHACGNLPYIYDTYNDAIRGGEDWLAEMIALDDDPEGAAELYSFEVIEGHMVNGKFVAD